MERIGQELQNAYDSSKAIFASIYAEYFYEELEGESKRSSSSSLSGGARSSVIANIEQRTSNINQMRDAIESDTRELNTLKAQLVVLITKKNRRKEHYPFYLFMGDNHVRRALFFLNLSWLCMTIAALCVNPFHGMSSHLLWFILSFTVLGIFDVDALFPKIFSVPQMDFSWMYLAFRLVVIDVLGISVMSLRSDYLSEGFQKHIEDRQKYFDLNDELSITSVRFTIFYFTIFYFWYIGRTLIMAPMKRSYPKLMSDFSLVSFIWSDLFSRFRRQEGRMPWKWFWGFQLSLKEAMYTGTVSDPIFAVAGSNDEDRVVVEGRISQNSSLLSQKEESSNGDEFGNDNENDDTEVIVLGDMQNSRDSNGTKL